MVAWVLLTSLVRVWLRPHNLPPVTRLASGSLIRHPRSNLSNISSRFALIPRSPMLALSASLGLSLGSSIFRSPIWHLCNTSTKRLGVSQPRLPYLVTPGSTLPILFGCSTNTQGLKRYGLGWTPTRGTLKRWPRLGKRMPSLCVRAKTAG